MRQHYFLSVLLVFLALPFFAQEADVVDEKLTTASNIAATINNLGIVGNSFRGSFNVEGFASCEFPRGSNIEHLFDGGLWIGGIVNGEIAVSTGAVDAPTGYSPGRAGFEFTSKTPLKQRSNRLDNPFFSADAVSPQDFVSIFTDTSRFINTGSARINISDHDVPLGVEVTFESYNWDFSFVDFFIILNFKIKNISDIPIDSMYVGYWADGVVRNIQVTRVGGTPFFNKGGNGFIESLGLAYEFDATGDIGFTDSYFATKYLGGALYESDTDPCPQSTPVSIHYNTWQFQNTSDPLFFFPSSDRQKYTKLAVGLESQNDWDQIQQQINAPGNRSNLVSAGSLPTLFPGEVWEVAFAIVCARRVLDGLPAAENTPAQRGNLIRNAQRAQFTFFGEDRDADGILDPTEDINNNGELDDGEDINGNGFLDLAEDLDEDGCIDRYVLPVPPPAPRTRIFARDNKIEIFWDDFPEDFIDPFSKEQDFEGYAVYKTALGFDTQDELTVGSALNLIASWDSTGNSILNDNGFSSIRLDEPVIFPGDTIEYQYSYTIENVSDGWQHAVAVTAFDRGAPELGLDSLESSALTNLFRVFPGKQPNNSFINGDPFAYPNPYYIQASWEGSSIFEEDRKLIFANLPARCQIRIYTVSGDLVDVIRHNEAYNGNDTRWHQTYSNSGERVFSGGEHSWDLLSADNQIIARGLYLFIVEDMESGDIYRGKFVIIK